jgi:extracellular factor (EF) 3-hydroxypalmitic acid methyl ester biosynthesis protein
MLKERFFDQTLLALEQGNIAFAYPMLAGKLYADYMAKTDWVETRETLHNHPLHALLLEDPYSARAAAKPRGYAGDAELIDLAYNRIAPEGTTDLAMEMFQYSVGFPASEGVRNRRDYAQQRLTDAWAQSKKICVLACGHLREADILVGKDMSLITAVDQDPLSLAVVRNTHGTSINLVEANVIHFLRDAAKQGQTFDLIYTLGLTDYFDTRAMTLLHRLMKACLTPSGEIMVANFLPGHLAIGWMDAVMDWHLIYRTEIEMEHHASEIGMKARTFRDPTDSIVFCEMHEVE